MAWEPHSAWRSPTGHGSSLWGLARPSGHPSWSVHLMGIWVQPPAALHKALQPPFSVPWGVWKGAMAGSCSRPWRRRHVLSRQRRVALRHPRVPADTALRVCLFLMAVLVGDVYLSVASIGIFLILSFFSWAR